METEVTTLKLKEKISLVDKLKGTGADAEEKAARKKMLIRAGGAVAALVLGYVLYAHFMFISTDNAQIQANTVLLAPRVAGYITKVNVIENQKVKAGEVLAEID